MPDDAAHPATTIVRWAGEIRGQASALLHYATNEYDRERARRLIALAGEMMAAGLDLPAPDVQAIFARRLDYLTPLSVADAAVFDDAGRILLLQRHDDALWATPGGACEFEESAAQTAVRELAEEVGVQGEAVALLGVWDSRRHPSRSPYQLYNHLFLCRIVAGTPATSPEALAVGWFAPDALPPLSGGHTVRVPQACTLYQEWRATGHVTPYFDP